MFADLICEKDVAWAAELMGLGADGFAPVDGDDSRLKAMLNLNTADFEACPGSGKTTLLVAKLAMLALRWPHRQQGICVLSHTNAARNEISARLSGTATGIALIRYPHFVGTIHSFVNEFLAMPWLRSKGINVRRVDTQMAILKRWFMLTRKTRTALELRGLDQRALIYTRADYTGGDKGNLGSHTPTYNLLVDASRRGSEEGYFCFDEMFVWANELIDRHPEIAIDLRKRFTMLFIDEAQDNSEQQSALLHRIFCAGDGPSVRQRFGDSNQAIYSRPGVQGANTDPFPGVIVHGIARSYRFAQGLADQVKGFGVVPQMLVGAGPPRHVGSEPKASVIFLFDDASVQSVLPRYCSHLIDSFDLAARKDGVFTAVAGVHKLDENDRVPRAMGHYVPSYDPEYARKDAVPSNFAQYISRGRVETVASGNCDRLVNATASALLAASELAGSTRRGFARKSPHRQVIEILNESDAEASYHSLQEMIVTSCGEIAHSKWHKIAQPLVETVVRQLSGIPNLSADVAAFLAWPQTLPAHERKMATAGSIENFFEYPSEVPQVRVRLGSIHSVKGETHTATLVLESFYNGHHLCELKPWLLGRKTGGVTVNAKGKAVREGPRILGRLKLHYVAMTRPTHLLCLAMRKDTFVDGELDLLAARGWTIIDCREPKRA